MSWNRRNVLQAAAAGTGYALFPAIRTFAQGASEVLRAPKYALVIGNNRYRDTPLTNPVNDARGMAAVLTRAGFTVTTGTDLTHAEMREAIGSYGERLATRRAVGVFYFAGHAAQLAWRNYLIPIGADIADVAALRDRAIDVNGLIEGIRRARNPMNMIILDACRDNPFRGAARLEQRGLSQVDAPPGTLLAYATAPGNTAIDGDGGEHGLYTGELLRELAVQEVKVEDVFKRVRLAVRRRSKGFQVPWESTSLEEDFWFFPPRETRKLVEEEIQREFAQELALWEKIREAREPEPFEDYLRRYPSGRFTELAQLQLDRALARLGEKKVEAMPAPENPYTKGTVAVNTAYKIGDFYSYRQSDLLTGLDTGSVNLRVTAITDSEVIYNKGRVATDLLGNGLRFGDGTIWSPNQTTPTEFAVGRRWKTRFHVTPRQGGSTVVDLEIRIADRETIRVPAGTFNAFRVEATGWQVGTDPHGVAINRFWNWKTWHAPGVVRRPVAQDAHNRSMTGAILRSERRELVSFKES